MRKLVKALLWIVGILAVTVGILRLTLIDFWTVPDDPILGAAVAPTMAPGDVVVLLTKGKAGFGDLVRCADPENPAKFVVGRIAGVEGDVVETVGASLKVNGQSYNGQSACPKTNYTVKHPTSGAETKLNCDVVTMGGGWHYRGSSAKPFPSTPKRAEVGPGMLYLVSDDREFHDDSRDFGSVRRETCKGRPILRLIGSAGWADDDQRMTFLH
jgi:signal peptidase I